MCAASVEKWPPLSEGLDDLAMNVLAIGAHFDDLELGCSGTLARHVCQGDRVTMLVVTHSAYKDPRGRVVRAAGDALEEGRLSAQIIGAELVCLGCGTLEVSFDDSLCGALLEHIERLEIGMIYSHWIHDVHRDHQVVARSALMAGKRVPRFLMYRSNLYDASEQFVGSFYSDISDTINVKLEAVGAHKSELRRVRGEWLETVSEQGRSNGRRIGVAYAESFEVVRYLV